MNLKLTKHRVSPWLFRQVSQKALETKIMKNEWHEGQIAKKEKELRINDEIVVQD